MIEFKIANGQSAYVDSWVWIVDRAAFVADGTAFPATGYEPKKVKIVGVDRDYISVKELGDISNPNKKGYSKSPADVFSTEREAFERVVQMYRNHLLEYTKASGKVQEAIDVIEAKINSPVLPQEPVKEAVAES